MLLHFHGAKIRVRQIRKKGKEDFLRKTHHQSAFSAKKSFEKWEVSVLRCVCFLRYPNVLGSA